MGDVGTSEQEAEIGPASRAAPSSALSPVVAAESEYSAQELDVFRRRGSKLDPVRGRFVPFPGLTVVCDVRGSGEPPLSQIAEVLKSQPTLREMFLPLPPESYHVTTLDILCKHCPLVDDGAWSALLGDPRWAAAADVLEEARALPRLRFRKLIACKSTLVAELEAADAVTAEHPAGLPVNKRLVELLGLGAVQKYPWHMTLAYRRIPEGVGTYEASTYQAEMAVVEEAIRAALPQHLPLDHAKLCRFPDMCHFVPWDGREP